MRLAVDVCVPKAAKEILEHKRHDIVAEADTGTPDHVWFGDALSMGAELVITNDNEVLGRARAYGIETLETPDGFSGRRLTKYIVREVTLASRRKSTCEDKSPVSPVDLNTHGDRRSD